jgi:hypothetical protein
MAKRSAARRTSSAIVLRPVQRRAPSTRTIVVRTRTAAPVKHHKKKGRGAGGTGKHLTYALLGAAALGFLDKSSFNLPTIPILGKAGTVGLGLWAYGKYGHSAMAGNMATGPLSIAIYELVKEGSVSGVEGDDVDGDEGGFGGGI